MVRTRVLRRPNPWMWITRPVLLIARIHLTLRIHLIRLMAPTSLTQLIQPNLVLQRILLRPVTRFRPLNSPITHQQANQMMRLLIRPPCMIKRWLGPVLSTELSSPVPPPPPPLKTLLLPISPQPT